MFAQQSARLALVFARRVGRGIEHEVMSVMMLSGGSCQHDALDRRQSWCVSTDPGSPVRQAKLWMLSKSTENAIVCVEKA
jgi:hypothetical protein